VTLDHVNPEAPWPHLEALERITAETGKQLVQRFAIYPAYAQQPEHWLHHGLRAPVLRLIDAEGFPGIDDWSPGQESIVPAQGAVGHGSR
jgi:FO synthase